MNDTEPKRLADVPGAPKARTPGLNEDWQCEHCKRTIKIRDSHLSWCLNIICADCAEKER